MTDAERDHMRTAVSRGMERGLIREAMTASAATETIGRRLGDELITASREAIAAWHERRNSENRMAQAIAELERLVGRP
jgi:ribosomal protein S7